MSHVRGFTGWSIPVELIEVHKLDWPSAILWAEIHALSKGPRGCFAGNDHFAKNQNLSENRISKLIAGLKKLGLVEQISFDGRVRVLRAVGPALASTPTPIGENTNADLASTPTLNWAAIEKKEKLKIEVEEEPPKAPQGGHLPSTPVQNVNGHSNGSTRVRRRDVEASAEGRLIIQAFASVFKDRFRVDFLPNAKTDVPAANGLAVAGRPAEVVRQVFDRATRMTAKQGWWNAKCRSLPHLLAHWNEIRAEQEQQECRPEGNQIHETIIPKMLT